MASKEYCIEKEIFYQDLIDNPSFSNEIKPKFIQDFIKPFKSYLPDDLTKEFRLSVKIRKFNINKYNPFLRLAKPKESKNIVDLIKDTYEGTYPYKEMEDPNEIKRLIKLGKYKFIVFLNEELEIIGSTCFVLDIKEKKGYLRSLVVKKEWLGVLDTKKAYIAACLMIWNKYREKILFWWAETRTADAKTQCITSYCALKPIALLPNKDIFYNKVESDLMIIAYNKEVFTKCRRKKIPRIIPSIYKVYSFSKRQYGLEFPKIIKITAKNIDKNFEKLQKRFKVQKSEDHYKYVTYKFSFKNSNSFFKFLYTPRVQNFEKTKYRVKNLRELYFFLEKFQSMAKKLHIRYMEAHVSAYRPSHQHLFFEMGLNPRGYIPAWKLNHKNGYFEDYILFNKYNKELEEMDLIPESLELLNFIKI